MDILAFLLMVALFVTHAYRSDKAKQEKKRTYSRRERLHNMALRFRDECMEESKKAMAQYTAVLNWKRWRSTPDLDYMSYRFISDYIKAIEELEKEYRYNYTIKYADGDAQLRCEAEDFLHSYLLDEYWAEISEIANTFRDIGQNMKEQISELKENYNKHERS